VDGSIAFSSGYFFNVFLAFPACCWPSLGRLSRRRLNKLIFALCIIGWVGYARLIRAQVLKVREYDFVRQRGPSAPETFAFFLSTFCRRHPALDCASDLGMAGAVLSEASLSFSAWAYRRRRLRGE